jgi:hypothetical protein
MPKMRAASPRMRESWSSVWVLSSEGAVGEALGAV